MRIKVTHLQRCLDTLEAALSSLHGETAGTVLYDVFRHAVIKGFELSLETSGNLLRRALKAYGGSPGNIDALVYKEVLRQAGKRGLLAPDEIERWFVYRDNRNSTVHDYGESFAAETLTLLPDFIRDARALAERLYVAFDHD